jgi:hypothetical protein
MKLDGFFDQFKVVEMEKLGHPRCVIATKPTKNLTYEPTKLVSHDNREKLNFGFNKTLDQMRQTDYKMTPEMQQLVDALGLQKDKSNLKYLSHN